MKEEYQVDYRVQYKDGNYGNVHMTKYATREEVMKEIELLMKVVDKVDEIKFIMIHAYYTPNREGGKQ